ncbi:4953_t:CDS:2, partial [Acaulospora colombiana]
FNERSRQSETEYFEKPPVSDTIVPTPMASAFRNMFDDSLTRSWTMLRQVTKHGFITSDNVHIRGSVVLLNGELFLWDVPQGVGHGKGESGGWKEFSKPQIPILEFLIFGTGKTFVPIPSRLRDYIYNLGLQIDCQDTEADYLLFYQDNALTTFNVLAEEGRNVAAVLLPIHPTSARTENRMKEEFGSTDKSEDQPAADYAFLNTPSAEGRLGKTNFIHFQSQPSRPTKLSKRGGVISPRFHHTAVVIGSNVFMIGGQSSLDNSTALPTTLLVMSSSTLVVNEQNSAKVSVAGHGAVPTGGSKVLILFGEKSVTPPTLAGPVQQIDVQTGTLNALNVIGTAPSARYAHTAALVDNKVYVIGGMNASSVLGDVSYVDLSSNSWNLINIPWQAVAGHSTAVIDKYLITCFGFNNKLELQNDCSVFDTTNNVYVKSEVSGNPPPPRSYSSMVSQGSGHKILYIFGGLDKSTHGYNDLYTLDATNLPILTWSPVSMNANSNPGLIPSPRGAHSAAILSDIMLVWGGYSGANLSDARTYLFDIKVNAWVDAKTAETQNDPYIRPGGQLGSNPDLPTNNEDKKIQTKDVPTLESTTSELVPTTSPTQTRSSTEKESKKSDDSIIPSGTSPSIKQIKRMSTDSQRTKRTHKRTSSVSLTPADLANITRPRSYVHHKSSLSTSSISNSTNRSSFLSSTFDPTPSRNSLSTTITPLDSPTFEKGNRCDSRATSKSVNSMQWVGFNSHMIDEREKERFSLHVRNGTGRKSVGSDDGGYVIRGDYIDTTDRRSYGGDFFDHEDIISAYDPQKRRINLRNTLGRNFINAIPEKEDTTFEEVKGHDNTSSKYDTRESDIVDKYAHQNPDDEDERSSKKSKRSSKRTSRVSFALRNEKIEFDETESSKSVSLARTSGRTPSQSSGSSSETPSIIEEEGELLESMTPKASTLTLKTLHLYENDKDEFDLNGGRLSRFSLSIFDIGKEQSTSHEAVSQAPGSTTERTKSSEVRHSIKELMMDQGVLWAIQDMD